MREGLTGRQAFQSEKEGQKGFQEKGSLAPGRGAEMRGRGEGFPAACGPEGAGAGAAWPSVLLTQVPGRPEGGSPFGFVS